MARGWESKSVEDQIAEKESRSRKAEDRSKQASHREKREGLMLARARTVTDLKSTRNAQYKVLLERTLAHLDAQLAELDLAS